MNRIKEILTAEPFSEKEDQLMKILLESKFDDELRMELQEDLKVNHGIFKKKRASKGIIKKLIIIGAIAASLIVGWIVINPLAPQLNVQDRAFVMLESNHSYHPGVTKGLINQEFRSDAITSYNEGNYKVAADYFLKIESPTEEDRFYLGLSLLKSEDAQNSIPYFLNLVESENFQQEVMWYLALSYIISGDNTNAIEALDRIKIGEYQYRNAQELRSLLQ